VIVHTPTSSTSPAPRCVARSLTLHWWGSPRHGAAGAGNLRLTSGVRLLVQPDAKPGQIPALRSAHPRRMLADTGGKVLVAVRDFDQSDDQVESFASAPLAAGSRGMSASLSLRRNFCITEIRRLVPTAVVSRCSKSNLLDQRDREPERLASRRLMTRSYLVGCSTGRVGRFDAISALSTKLAARRCRILQDWSVPLHRLPAETLDYSLRRRPRKLLAVQSGFFEQNPPAASDTTATHCRFE
jgi:hypothetical protein